MRDGGRAKAEIAGWVACLVVAPGLMAMRLSTRLMDGTIDAIARIRLRVLRGLAVVLLVTAISGCETTNEPARIAPGVRMRDERFYSVALGRSMPYRVFLPEHVPDGVRLPVVYLLHGRGPDYHDWSVNSDVSKYALPASSWPDADRSKVDAGPLAHGLVLVMPEGGDSYYMNAALRPGDRYEDYLVNDLPADLGKKFPVRGDRAGTAIVGMSMGGFGAVTLGLLHPERYVFAGGLSAAVDVPQRRFRLGRAGLWWSFRRIFGPMGSPERAERDPFVLAGRGDPARAPYFYLTAGLQEPLYEPDRRFAGVLEERGFAAEFHASPGGHDWELWESQLPGCFRRLAAVMEEPRR